ncbi:MAG: hypothetical protein HYX26_00160 [Acidobacteriales bacterium]|nr:hypothetical protein [Terriglobales bacterium]
MRAILYIAFSFFRQQKLVVLVLLAFTLVLLGVFLSESANNPAKTELAIPYLQLIGYGIFMPFLLCTQMMYLERKTRRILGILSKGIYRWQYITGLWLAGMFVSATQLTGLGLAMQLAAVWRGWEFHIWPALGAAFVAAALAGAVAVTFGCFLHPMVATFLAGGLLAVPYWLSSRSVGGFDMLLPVVPIFRTIMRSALLHPWGGDPWLLVVALAQAALLLYLASLLFARIDVTSAVE